MIIVVRLGPPTQLLICLFGGLQCGVHNIPIEIWLPKGYPREAPYMFIQPSPGISIRPTQSVDNHGRVNHPMLQMWRPEYGVGELLRVIGGILTMDPPFFPGTGRPMYGASPLPIHASYTPPPITAASPNPPVAISRTPIPSPIGAMPTPSPIPTDDMPRMRRMLKDKLNSRFPVLQKDLSLEMERVLAESSRLATGEESLTQGIKCLWEEAARLEGEIDGVRKQKEQLINLATSTNSNGLDVDALVIPDSVLGKQTMEVLANDLAIQDLIYTISKIFHEGSASLPLSLYLKYIRDLAREQFLQKALLIKLCKNTNNK